MYTLSAPTTQSSPADPAPALTAAPPHLAACTAVVAVHLQVTEDQPGTDVAITHERYGVAVGEPYPAVLDAFASCDVSPPRELTSPTHVDLSVPRIVEGMHVSHGRAVFLEAQLLALSAGQATELSEMLSSEAEPDRGELGWMYAEESADAWRAGAPDRRIALSYLDDQPPAHGPRPTPRSDER